MSEKLVSACSVSRKCEYTCNDGFVPFNGQCIGKATYGDMTVPSHIRPNEDYPLIMCQGSSDDRYFKYQITRVDEVLVTDIIYTSPVYPMNGNGYGSHIHTLGLPDLGKYAVACLSGPNMDGVVATPFVSAPNVEDVGIIEVVSEAPHIDRLDRYRDVDGNGSKELDDTESIAAAMDA